VVQEPDLRTWRLYRLWGEDPGGSTGSHDQHQWSIAEQESPIIGKVLEAESRAIDAAASRLEAAFSSAAVTQTASSATFR
jgi:hypothetical protein